MVLRFTSKIYAVLHQGGCRLILSSPTLHLLDQSQFLQSTIGKPQGKTKWKCTEHFTVSMSPSSVKVMSSLGTDRAYRGNIQQYQLSAYPQCGQQNSIYSFNNKYLNANYVQGTEINLWHKPSAMKGHKRCL